MRGRKPYNIRNVEAHLNSFRPIEQNNNLVFQNTAIQVIKPSPQQQQNEFINSKFGVSKYASNLVSGKMFKKV